MRDHQDGNSVDTNLQFHLKFNTLYTYDEHGSVIPPWRRERLESQIPRIVKRRVKLSAMAMEDRRNGFYTMIMARMEMVPILITVIYTSSRRNYLMR